MIKKIIDQALYPIRLIWLIITMIVMLSGLFFMALAEIIDESKSIWPKIIFAPFYWFVVGIFTILLKIEETSIRKQQQPKI